MPLSYDIIVIGAGLGGLTAAARLVREGLRVLVLDRNPHPAGTAYVFHRQGFQFPMGPLGFSTPSIVRRTLQGLGDEHPLDLLRVDYRLRAFGLDLPFSRPRLELEGELLRQFPDEREGITHFFKTIEDLNRLLTGLSAGKDPRTLAQTSASSLACDFLKAYIKDERLRRFLGSQGTAEPHTTMLSLAAQWNLMLNEGIWYPAGGLRTLGDRLVRLVLRSPGKGEIRLGVEATRIRIHEGKIGGVELATGEVLEAPVVISNADFKNTFLRLMERRMLPAGLHEQAARARQTESNLQVSLGLKKNGLDLSAFTHAGHLIFRRGEEAPPRWELPEIRPEELAAGELELCLWSRDDPALAPVGGEVLVIRTAADYAHFARQRPAWKKRAPDYLQYKNRLGWALVQEAETLVPGLRQAVQVLDVATPLTFEERGGRSEGAVAGWSWDARSSRERFSRDLVRTPITGLFMVGYQAFSTLFSGGIPTAVESGNRAAEYILRGAGPVKDFRLPGEKEE